ncbi:MAG: HNH endonuclease [Thermoguttaceae bacterium]
MTNLISDEVRRLVVSRAGQVCEYCLIHEEDTYFGCEIDHIISLKHGGSSEAGNLAYACLICNRRKGADLGSMIKPGEKIVRFFNPRTDFWQDHFRLDGSVINARTEIGEVTARIFGFNAPERILERETLIAVGRYPAKRG